MTKIKTKFSTLALTSIASLTIVSTVPAFANEQVGTEELFGTEPIVAAESEATDNATNPGYVDADWNIKHSNTTLLDDYSYYVGTWMSPSEGITIVVEADGKVYQDGIYLGQIKNFNWQSSIAQGSNIILAASETVVEGEFRVVGGSVVAAPANVKLSLGGDGDTSKDRLFVGNGVNNEYGADSPFYREADYKAMEAAGVLFGRGGADLVDRVTAQVYANDPDTGQPYTLEKLLELGKISAEDYQHYVTLRQASQEVKSTQETPVTTDSDQQTDTVQVTQEYTSTEVAQPVQEEKVTAKNSNQSATATKKVLPQTADMPSLLGFAGLGLIIMGGLGLKKKN